MASGDLINYTIRPAKCVERKIIRDVLFNLNGFNPISEYKYIGFGSKYFSDFSLFHRTLHIHDMVSIEGDTENKDKYEFNKPFDCIKIEMGHSNDVLSRIEIDRNFIAWLDYDYSLDATMIIDIGILLENLLSGSIILVSYNSIAHKIGSLREEFKDLEATHKELLYKKLMGMVPSKLIPDDIPETKLSQSKTFSNIVKKIFETKIKSALIDKNSALDEADKWQFKQILYFHYKDGADMGTLGWFFFQNKDAEKVSNCMFESNHFFRSADESYEIVIPNLTVKETSSLLTLMPMKGTINRDVLPEGVFLDSDILSFSEIYKYYPSFMNVEFT